MDNIPEIIHVWNTFVANCNEPAFKAACRRIRHDEYGVDKDSVAPSLYKVFQGFFGPEPWKEDNIIFVSLFAKGLTHAEGISFGTALRNITPSNGKTENILRRANALMARSDKETFFQALGRMIALDHLKTMKVDLGLLTKDLHRYFVYGNPDVKHHWVLDLCTNPNRNL